MRDTIDMAREAEIGDSHGHIIAHELAHLKAFEALVRNDEREACAKVCEDSVEYAGDTLAEAIRARSNT